MSTTRKNPNSMLRSAVAVALFAVAGIASADLQFKVSVEASGALGHGMPRAGQYTVSYRAGVARMDLPDGRVRLFDFNASKVALLDTKSGTYKLSPLNTELGPGQDPPQNAFLRRDRTARTQPMFGSTAERLLISVSAPATTSSGAQNSGGSDFSLSGAFAAARSHQQTQGLGAPTPKIPLNGPGALASVTIIQASTWVTNGAAVKSAVSSVSPLVMVGVPRPLVASITQNLDTHGVIPVSFVFSFNNGAVLKSTVTAVNTATLPDLEFSVPVQYKLLTGG